VDHDEVGVVSAAQVSVSRVQLRDDGWKMSEKTVADSMRRQGLLARRIKRHNGLTRQDKTALKFPDLLKSGLHRDPAQRPLGR